MRARFLCPALTSLLLAASSVGAQEPPAREAPEAGEAHANEAALFLGGTAESGETFFTIGAEYERRIGPLFGAGVVVEHVSTLDAWVFLAPLSIRPLKDLGLKLYVGPGVESKVPRSEEELAERETAFLLRAGIAWALEWKRLTFTPQVEFDFTREPERWEHAVVFGVAIGFGF